MGDIEYNRFYSPGYTGHVPKKNDIFGCTTGDINRILTGQAYKPSNYDIDIAQPAPGRVPTFAKRTFYSKPPPQDQFAQTVQFGNHSKYGENWIGGPTNNIKAQHIPGYKGYIPGIKSENLFGKSYARSTSQAINKEFVQGTALPVPERFKTQTMSEFNKDNFRRIRNSSGPLGDPAMSKDIRDASNFNDGEFQGLQSSQQQKNIYLDLPVVGYSGYKSIYRPATITTNHRKDPFFNLNPLRPRLKGEGNINIQTQPEFQKMSDGFQKAVTFSPKNAQNGADPFGQDLVIPVTGYTGHRMGYRSQNFFGKNQRDCTIQSKFIQKMMV